MKPTLTENGKSPVIHRTFIYLQIAFIKKLNISHEVLQESA